MNCRKKNQLLFQQMNNNPRFCQENHQKYSIPLFKNQEKNDQINLIHQVKENKNKYEEYQLAQNNQRQNKLSIIKSLIDIRQSQNQQMQASNKADQEQFTNYKVFFKICLNAISDLANTQQQVMTQEQVQQQQIQQLKSFFSTIQVIYKNELDQNKLDYKCYNQITDLKIDFDNYLGKKNDCQMHIHLFKQMIDASRLQLEQSLSNCLLNDFVTEENQLNNAFLAATLVKIYQQRVLKLPKQPMKLLFIDISFIESDNYPLYRDFHNLNDCVYIKLIPTKDKQDLKIYNSGQNYHIINFYQPEKVQLTWAEFKLIFKFQIKKLFKYFNYNFCVLSTCCDIENDKAFRLQSDCQRKLVEKVRKIAKDKLFIHSIFRQIESAQAKQHFLSEEQIIQKYKQHLNPLYLGNFENQTDKYYKFGKIPNQEFVLKQIQISKQYNVEISIIKQYAQIIGNLCYPRIILPKSQTLQQPEIALIQDKVRFLKLKYQNIYLDFQQKSILRVSYEKKKIVVFQIDVMNKQEILYIGDFSDFKLNEIQCQKVDLSGFINQSLSGAGQIAPITDEKYISMAIKDNSVIIYIPCLERIIIVDINNLNVQAIQEIKDEIQYQHQRYQVLKQRRGVTLINQAFDNDYDIMAMGGEIINSPSLCNIIQQIKFNKEGDVIKSFKSVVISKQNLMKTNKTFIPWPSNIILQSKEVPFKLLLLPGSYENKLDKYNQYINYEFQTIATVLKYLTLGKLFQFNHLKIEYKEILIKFNDDLEYQNCEKLSPIPLSELSSNQYNQKLTDSGWTILYTLAQAINLQKYFKDALNRTYIESSILIVDLKIYKDSILEVKQKLLIRTDRNEKMKGIVTIN